MHSRCLQLNGLNVTLCHQPDATQAAALVKVAAGSHDEPERWPGLAHLLEHLLFTGSQRWPHDGRLMSWVQANGGQVNATTQARESAWFFEVTPDNFSEGLLRMQDMLSAPSLTREAISQEIAVIDAEYRLLQRHAAARAEAAMFTPVTSPAQFKRFHVGNRMSFGDNVTDLQAAPRGFSSALLSLRQPDAVAAGPTVAGTAHRVGEGVCRCVSAAQQCQAARCPGNAFAQQGAGVTAGRAISTLAKLDFTRAIS
ncbi:insulinase family protein [Pantoea ananatis]